MNDDKATITITGGDHIDKRTLARFLAQQLQRAIGHGGANLTLTFDGSSLLSGQVEDGAMFMEFLDIPIELFIPNHWRLVSYKINERGDLSSAVVGISAVGEHSFRGMAKKTALRLHQALTCPAAKDLRAWSAHITYVSVGAEGDEILVEASTSERTSLADMTAEVLRRVRAELMDAP
jgi:hypothetical protein